MTSLLPYSLIWKKNSLEILDQTKLPFEVSYISCERYSDVITCIKSMNIRGAPAIGIAGAYAAVLLFQKEKFTEKEYSKALLEIEESRPTAVNLSWALKRMKQTLASKGAEFLDEEAQSIFIEDREINLKISHFGASLIKDKATIIHHCNTGSLATSEYGTALGIIRVAHEQGKEIFVYVDETRPRFQGGLLTAFELSILKIPHKIIIDSAAAFVMQKEKIDFCFVGCDRVAKNGDVANKIGTYALSLAASIHNVPFYVAAPFSSIDTSISSGDLIPIEERSENEIKEHSGSKLSFPDSQCYNPGFDITPSKYVTGYITENGILKAPF